MEDLIFENRAWEKAQFPRLHMKEPETFKHGDLEIHFGIGYHHGESERIKENRWYLDIYKYQGKDCLGKLLLFRSIKEIAEYIKEEYNKNPIIPKRWL